MTNELKKILTVFFFIPFINLGFIIFALEIYLDMSILIILIAFTFILSLDIIIRPISEKKDHSKYPKISVMLFLLLPILSIIPYLEFKFLIQHFITIWNDFSIYLAGMMFLLCSSIILIYSRITLWEFTIIGFNIWNDLTEELKRVLKKNISHESSYLV